ncbi:ATP-binding protein [Schlesneria paludicola]|uniref:ATP-binding protein n=1 Tax=Schlesneria paludicola TaxID=360056 RepID=UPI00058C8D14|nr:ATP-binding protein [Schlesneria paludicola]
MQDYEKLGVFYLGKTYDMESRQIQDDLLLYDAKDLTTHAVCVGMTGSGKTGLCLSLLEEAAIDGIPAICIDPKGDLGNLLLAFPNLQPSDFRPWIDPADATRAGLSPDDYSVKMAKVWKDGLAAWGQPPERIKRYRDAVDISIYTPASNAGLPLTVLKSFSAPPAAIIENSESMRERVASAASGLLALLGNNADPLQSKEHILLSTILDRSWREGKDVDLGGLIRLIQKPNFDRVGVVDLESFYPSKERFAFAMTLNNLIASPGFQAWMEGESLDIQRLMYTPEGKPRLTIISIAHLSDSERMFFVTILLNEVVTWMRAQSGTSSLRAILYMDEIFGYFPPTANPPSKTPMLTLLKQARAFGVGIVLATQNPVDLDYKGLSNAGTWFLGRLQTERDKARVLEGLEGASAAAGAKFDRGKMEKILAGLGNRVFLMNNVHEDHPVVFQSRWALSFLRGPVNRDEIARLMADKKAMLPAASKPATALLGGSSGGGTHPVLPPGIEESFVVRQSSLLGDVKLTYRPGLLASTRVRFVQATAGIDSLQDMSVFLPAVDKVSPTMFDDATISTEAEPEQQAQPDSEGSFASLPGELSRAKTYTELQAALKDHVYKTEKLTLWKCAELKQTSNPGESEGDFRVRIAHAVKEQRDQAVEKLRAKYGPKLATIQEQLRKAMQKVEKEKLDARNQTTQVLVTVGTSILGAVFGRKTISATNMGKIATGVRAAGRMEAGKQDVTLAEESVEAIQARYDALNKQFSDEATALLDGAVPENLRLDEVTIAPKKTDVTINKFVLCWTPWIVDAKGNAQQAW